MDLEELSWIFLIEPRFLYLFNMTANAKQAQIYNRTMTKTAMDFFKSNFLQLNVEFGDQSFVELKDVAAFSVDAMGAQIGGVLSLWLGVTVTFIFEAFEFIYVYLTNCLKKEPKQARSSSVAPAVETKMADSVVVEIE